MHISDILNVPQIKVDLIRKHSRNPGRTVLRAVLNPDNPIQHIRDSAMKVADKFMDGNVKGVRILSTTHDAIIFTVIPTDGFDIFKFYISVPESRDDLRDSIVKSVRNLAHQFRQTA